jgi:hypothetical protein
MTNPIALPKPVPKSSGTTAAVLYYEGNVQLMEARFLELSSSIRALYRSVEELREFCKDPETQDEADHVVVEAIFENLGVLRKQRKELVSVVEQMNQALHSNNRSSTNVPDDIAIMVLGDEDELKQQRQLKEMETAAARLRLYGDSGNGDGAAAAATTGDNQEDDAGVYL